MVRLSYLGVIVIWSTTPLAIQWSGQEVGFLFGVAGRMVIGCVLALALVMVLRLPMAWHKQAGQTYLAAGMGIYGAMMCVYWSAQFVPSGWISDNKDPRTGWHADQRPDPSYIIGFEEHGNDRSD